MQANPGGGRGRGRGRGPGKWTAATPSAEFLASLRPVPNQAPGSQGARTPPILLGPIAPPPVPMTLGQSAFQFASLIWCVRKVHS